LSEQKPSVWTVIISLLMLFVSGAWTVAAIISINMNKALGTIMLATATASNVSFLLTLLAAMLLYSGVERGERLRVIMVCLFAVGIVTLVYTVVLFMVAFLTRYPTPLD